MCCPTGLALAALLGMRLLPVPEPLLQPERSESEPGDPGAERAGEQLPSLELRGEAP